MSLPPRPAGAGIQLSFDVDLRPRNTLRVLARAPLLLEVDDAGALPAALADARVRGRPLLVLGGGSNLLFAGDPDGVLLSLRTRGIAVVDEVDHGRTAIVHVDAGVDWHGCVAWTLAQGLCGLENLALIPGTVGASPIQNIGAYGVELDQRVHAVHAWDQERGALRHLGRDACGFAYRDSRFKREPTRWIVTAVEFALSRTPRLALHYVGLADELVAHGVETPTASDVAAAVCRIRRRKLPDPAVIANAGSFFKNPVVDRARAEALLAAAPVMPLFPADRDASCKLSAAWLIDACGWKGHRDGDAGVSPGHALVLVNHGDASGAELLALARHIAASVQARFGVALEPEPRIVGAHW